LRVARRRNTTALALAAVLGLSACGNDLQPGAAATVNDVRISQDEVDEIVGAACEYTQVLRQQEGGGAGEPQRLDELRSTITTALIQFEIVDTAATERGVSASQSAVSAFDEQSQIPEGLSEDNVETLEQFFADFAMSQAQQAALGANAKDSEVTSISRVTPQDLEASAELLSEVTQAQDVVVNPAYGTWDGRAVVAGNGSLSDPVSDAAIGGEGGEGGEDTDPAAPADPAASVPADVPAVQLCG
jgi:hypothetical protein